MQKDSQRGFTIIETLIVLAIAGLILSLILIVIPTLQRNGRNNQRKQDVQAILSGVSQYALNNSGNIPGNNSFASGLKLSYYEPSDIVVQSRAPRQNVDLTTQPLNLNRVIIANHQKCDAGNATPFAAGYSDVVALYMTETGNNSSEQRCQEL